jgi:hypothetical protein
LKCGHQTWITRVKLERNIKTILQAQENPEE